MSIDDWGYPVIVNDVVEPGNIIVGNDDGPYGGSDFLVMHTVTFNLTTLPVFEALEKNSQHFVDEAVRRMDRALRKMVYHTDTAVSDFESAVDLPPTTEQTGKFLRRLATHHDHGAGWAYTRDTEIKHIRYRKDYQGRNRLDRRITRGLRQAFGRGFLDNEHWWRQGSLRQLWYHLYFSILVNVKDSNAPDGVLKGGSVIVHWEEDGEYIESVGPTVGERIADFLEAEPDNEHAKAIAAEMQRVWRLGIATRRKR